MSNIQFNFKGKRALVTGAGQGIGLQITRDFIENGAEVIAWEKSPDNIKNMEKSFSSESLKTKKVNVSSFDECKSAVSSLEKPIDFLVNNAGLLRDRSFAKMSLEEYSAVIQTNLNGVFYTTKSLLESFNPDSFKRIVNLSSMVALYGNFGQSNYVASKAGVIGFTKVWARELGRKGWTVNAIAPGFIQTDILKKMPPEIIKKMIDQVPVKRIGSVKDVSQSVLFLCSEEASYINGAVLEVTGGTLP